MLTYRRIVARCVLLDVALRDAQDHEMRGQRVNEAIHAARQLRREIRATLSVIGAVS